MNTDECGAPLPSENRKIAQTKALSDLPVRKITETKILTRKIAETQERLAGLALAKNDGAERSSRRSNYLNMNTNMSTHFQIEI
jgi:hypothetical protein